MSREPIYGFIDEGSIDRPTREELKAVLRGAGGRPTGEAETYMYLQHILQCARTVFILLEDHWWLRVTDDWWLAFEVTEVNEARKNPRGPVGNAL